MKEKEIRKYETMVEAINHLREEGYTEDFNIKPNCLECINRGIELNPDEFEIDGFMRFEGMTDPADSSILYIITSDKHNIKGTLVNSYGAYSDPEMAKMMDKLEIR